MPVPERQRGTVKWFSRFKGFGFILPDDGGPDVFVHYSELEGSGYRNLYEGDRVEYVLEVTPRGPKAVTVCKLRGSL